MMGGEFVHNFTSTSERPTLRFCKCKIENTKSYSADAKVVIPEGGLGRLAWNLYLRRWLFRDIFGSYVQNQAQREKISLLLERCYS